MLKHDITRKRGFVLLFVLAATPLFAQQGGWFKAGDHPDDYYMGTDHATVWTGASSGVIRSNKPDPQGFGTYMQQFAPTNYLGKRIRLSAYIKAVDVEQWAGMWMRVDGTDHGHSLAFDNMQNRPITGTQEWTRFSVVLDVAPEASAIAFGVLLHGKGFVWIDDVALETVGNDVPVTDMFLNQRPIGPRNLDFEADPVRR